MKTTPLQNNITSGASMMNRSKLTLKSKNGRTHEIVIETVEIPGKIFHRATGGGSGWSKKYYFNLCADTAEKRDAMLAEWVANHPELSVA